VLQAATPPAALAPRPRCTTKTRTCGAPHRKQFGAAASAHDERTRHHAL